MDAAIAVKSSRLLLLLNLISFVYAYRCPGPDWHPRRGSPFCYLFSPLATSTSLNFDNARKACRDRGGYLADIEDNAEYQYLRSRIGVNPARSITYWVGLSYEARNWTWVETGAVYTNQIPGFNPNSMQEFVQSTSKEKYRGVFVHYTNGDTTLAVEYTSAGFFPTLHPYICKANFSSKPLCRTEEGWDYVGSRCWKSMAELKEFNDAQKTCRNIGGYLAVPQSDDENARAMSVATEMGVKNAWLGFTVTKSESTPPAEELVWLDGSSFASAPYKKWSFSNPSQAIAALENGKQHCAFGEGTNGALIKWYLNPSCAERRSFVCESDTEICPYGWNHFDGLCYKIRSGEEEMSNFNDAKKTCNDDGGNLVIVQSADVQSFLENQLDNLGMTTSQRKDFWIGYSSDGRASPFDFRWVPANSISATSYTNWVNNQAPNDRSRRCAMMKGSRQGTTFEAKWYAASCQDRLPFICQARPEDALQENIVHPTLSCQAPFALYHDGCYYRSTERLNWDAANNFCTNMQSTLAEVFTGGENNYLAKMIEDDSWLGVRRITYTTDDGKEGAYYQYSDGENLTESSFTNFRTRNPQADKYCLFLISKKTGQQGLLVDTTGMWEHDVCTTERLFICHHRGELTEATDDPSEPDSPECGQGWVLRGKHCYKFLFTKTSFGLAAQTCQNQDEQSNLLYITSKEEDEDLQDLIKGDTVYSNSQFASTDTYWTSLQIVASNQWFWKYKTGKSKWAIPMGYSNWATNQPNPKFPYSTNQPYCMYLRKDNDKWESGPCTGNRAAICKKPARLAPIVNPTATPPPMNFTYGCPKEWAHVGSHCYHVNLTLLTWNDAQKACQDFSGHLATIYDPEQHTLLRAMSAGAWVGLNSIASPRDPRVFRNDDKDASHAIYTPWQSQLPRPGTPYGADDANCVASFNMRPNGLTIEPVIGQFSCGERKAFVCQIPEQAQELAPDDCVKPVHDAGCRRWGYGLGSSCFYMGNDLSTFGVRQLHTFEGARAFCQKNYGGDLAVLSSAEKLEFATLLAGSWASEYWVGLREQSTPGAAFSKWINGQMVMVSNWARNQPQGGRMGCVAMHGQRANENLPGDWYVDDCREVKFAMCEAPRQGFTNPPIIPTVNPIGCPSDWFQLGNESRNCYRAFYASSTPVTGMVSKLTWFQAETFCEAYGGNLASVHSDAEQTFITDTVIRSRQTGYMYWIGLYEDGNERWRWSDGQALTTTFFDPTIDHSSESSDVKDCVGIDSASMQWVKQNCELSWGWVCEIEAGKYTSGSQVTLPPLPDIPQTNATCGLNINGKWYYDDSTDNCFFVSAQFRQWEDAERECNGIGSHLASMNKDSHAFMTTVLSLEGYTKTMFWIGLRLRNPATLTHYWVDGDQANLYRAWGKDEPNPKGVQGCVVMSNENGKWLDDYCTRPNGYRYVCKKNKTPIVTTTTVAPQVAETWGCPEVCRGKSCQAFMDHCYYFSPVGASRNWTEALDDCQTFNPTEDPRLKSDLVSIHSQLEQDFLIGHMGTTKYHYWTGLHEDWDRQTLFWSDNSPVDYRNWFGREPLLHTESECIMMYGEPGRVGTWNDEICSMKAGYICKMRKDPSYSWQPLSDVQCADASSPSATRPFEHVNGACFAVLPVPANADPDLVCSKQWSEARTAAVTSPYENAFLRTMFAKMKNYQASEDRVRLGGSYEGGRLYWDAGCYPNFNNIRNFYSTSTDGKACIAMDYGGRWRTVPCEEQTQYVACEKRESECEKLEVEVQGTCPDGFLDECHNYCYKMTLPTTDATQDYINKKPWETAKIECQRLNASLLTIRSEAEQRCVEKYLERSSGPVWLGLYEDYNPITQSSRWRWLDEAFNYEGNFMNWDEGEPSNSNTAMRESCTEMKLNGKWNNVACGFGATRGYICEKAKIPYPDTYTDSTRFPPAQSTSPNSARTDETTVTNQPGQVTTPRPSPPTIHPDSTTASSATTDSGVDTTTPPPSTNPPIGLKLTESLSAGGVAGLAISVIVLIAGLTYGAYFLWQRKIDPASALTKNPLSFKSKKMNDQRSVIDEEENNDSYS